MPCIIPFCHPLFNKGSKYVMQSCRLGNIFSHFTRKAVGYLSLVHICLQCIFWWCTWSNTIMDCCLGWCGKGRQWGCVLARCVWWSNSLPPTPAHPSAPHPLLLLLLCNHGASTVLHYWWHAFPLCVIHYLPPVSQPVCLGLSHRERESMVWIIHTCIHSSSAMIPLPQLGA